MGIMNKRNAVLGWAVLKVGKRTVKRKAKAAVPRSSQGGGRGAKPALLAGLAALGGALFFRRRKSGDEEAS
jgi:MYXO-CTERM domain-containing protein